MARGKFITFEGGEGCGKSTQVKLLQSYLLSKGIDVVMTREPGGTRLGEAVRSLLKDELDDPPCDRAELLLFLAARAQLVRNVIKPALESGAWVVSDRFSDSTFAYQGYGRGLDFEVLRVANDFACDGIVPDMTFLLDIPSSVAAERLHSRQAQTSTVADRIELAGDDFHRRLKEGFKTIAEQSPERVVTIDADGTLEQVWERVCKSLKRLI